MIHIPHIEPVRIKTEEIPHELIYPGSMGYPFPQEVGPRIVYLDPRFSHPEGRAQDSKQEKARQAAMLAEIDKAGSRRFMDQIVHEQVGITRVHEVRERVFDELGTRHTAEFYERVFSDLLDTAMNVVALSTGVNPSTGNYYHDIAYLD
jgi:hypothetical protein